MAKRIVVALGGNALGANLPEQMEAVKTTSKAIVDLIEEGNEVVVVHGNGPQVGMIANAMAELTRSNPQKYIPCPLSVCGAMSQGYIGYDLQNALREEMLDRATSTRASPPCSPRSRLRPDDPAFADPVKPIGPWMSEAEAKELEADRGYQFIHDEKQGFRRVVASPKPVNIVELDTIKSLVESNHVVISCGGGGIPVTKAQGNHLRGAAAVIDKDFAAEKLAEQLDADALIILTAVEKVAVGFGTDHEQWLDTLTAADVKRLSEANEFGRGSMLPKVQAASTFAESKPGRTALITLLEKARDGLAGKTGTTFTGRR